MFSIGIFKPMRRIYPPFIRLSMMVAVCFLLPAQHSAQQLYEEEYGFTELPAIEELRELLPAHTDSVITILENDYERIMASTDGYLKNRTNYLLGLSYYFQGAYLISNYYYDLALQALLDDNQTQDYVLLEAIYNNKGINLQLLGNYEKSIETLINSLRLARLHSDTLGIGQSKLNIAVLFKQIRESDQAIEYGKEALDLFLAVGDPYYIALGEMNVGSFLYQRAPDRSVEHLHSALHGFEQLNKPFRLAETYYNLATTYLRNGKTDKAVEYALQSVEMNPIKAFNNLRLSTYNVLIDAYVRANEPERALPYIQEIDEAIAFEEINALEALDIFWAIAEKVLSLPENSAFREDHRALREEFTANMQRTRYSSIMTQFDRLSSIEPDYADSLEQKIDELSGSEQNKNAVAFLIFWPITIAGTGLILYMLHRYGYLPLLGRNSKADYIIKTITSQMSMNTGNTDQKKSLAADHPSNRTAQPNGNGTINGKVDKPTPNDSFEKIYSYIDKMMIEEQLYKNPDLSLKYLSNRMGINVKYISMAIKQETGLSYKDYVNSHAISLAIAKIKEDHSSYTNEKLSIICGYTSEATFYRNFKKVTGLTPSQFKKRLEKKQSSSIQS